MRISINRLWSSHGRGGLEGDRPSSTLDQQFRTEVQHIASLPTAHRRSRKFPPRYRLHPTEEVWRATGPPAPSSIIPVRSSVNPPASRPRTAEAGTSRFGTVFPYPKRSGGRPALQHPRPTIPHGSSAYRLHPDRAPQKPEISAPVLSSPIQKKGCRIPAGDCNSPLWSYSMKRRFIRSCCRPPKSDRCRPDSPPVCSGRGRAGRCHGRCRSGTRRSRLHR